MVWIPYLMHDYFTPKGLKMMTTHKYSTVNSTFYYPYVMSPLCAFIVDNNILPEWVA